MDGYIGEIKLFAGLFAPQGWMFCEGQQLTIQSNEALYSIIGTTYGGNATTNFNLPDLRGRGALGAGTLGSNVYQVGQVGGNPNAGSLQLQAGNLPQFPVVMQASTLPADSPEPVTGGMLATTNDSATGGAPNIYKKPSQGQPMVTLTAGVAGGSNVPVNAKDPFLAMHYIICVQGLYPTRS
ncbi:phage tail protein [Pseudogulbenkiania sp. MAI-1]|uniref:phage tail protein n=1 Tax=Pseudogulbenkiania sp. MAI-1 TaxID=990370 RepID=UPI00045E5F48|nr:tail fiber protein [Pseudogulbenkiania sp. MAI-1]